MELGCILVPRIDSPAHVELAERLGYDFAWVADSPTFMADPWITLGIAATRTRRIRLGAAVVTPRMRHVVANAGALATLSELAPGRTEMVLGSGFTSQAMIGEKPVRWKEVEEYLLAMRALLAGKEIEWNGAITALTYPALIGISLPKQVPLLVAAHGPKGYEAADRIADGIATNPMHGSNNTLAAHKRVVVQVNGTVLREGEGYGDERVLASAGPAAAMQLHVGEGGGARTTEELAGYAKKLESIDPARRHLVLHGSHFVEVTDFEREFVTPELIRRCTETGTAEEWKARLAGLEQRGVTGVMILVGGADIPGELAAFVDAVRG